MEQEKTAWRELLSSWERDEIELARYYLTYLRHHTEGHDRLVLIAHMATLLDRATGFSGIACPEGVEDAERLGRPQEEN